MTTSTSPSTQSSVTLVGRLGTRVEARVLPSGDEILAFTVVVDRPGGARSESSARVDSIPCQTTRAGVRKRVEGLEPGARVSATGRLQRRFWKTGSGLGSAMEVVVESLRRES